MKRFAGDILAAFLLLGICQAQTTHTDCLPDSNCTVTGTWTFSRGVSAYSGVTGDGNHGLAVTGKVAAGMFQDWHDASAGCAPYRGVVNVVDCGGDPTATADSSSAIRAAVTVACSHPGGIPSTQSLPVHFNPGTYLANNVDLSGAACAPLLEAVDDRGVIVQYNGTGTPGDYMVKLPSMSFGGFRGIEFLGIAPSNAMATYGVWLSGTVDNGFRATKSTVYGTLSHAIYHTGSGFTNWHMDHMRFGGIGGCTVYITGSASMENRPFTLENWTNDNSSWSNAARTWAEANGYYDGTHWGDAQICTNNGQGIVINLSNARVELNKSQIIQGNVDNGALVREWNTPGSQWLTVNLNGVVGYSSPLHEAMIVSTTGRVTVHTNGGAFTANGCIKNSTTQTFQGDKNCAAESVDYGYNYQGGGGLVLGASSQTMQRIESLQDPAVANYSLWHANDIVLHPASEAAAGTKGPIRYVTAPATGRSGAMAWTITSTAVVTSGSVNVSLDPGAMYLQPGDNITLVRAGPAAADLNAQITCADYVTGGSNCSGMTGPGIQVNATPSTSVNPATIKWQAATFHELPGAQTGSAAPSSGTWAVGEKVWNTNTKSGQPSFWVCTSSGTPAGGCPGAWVSGPSYGVASGIRLSGVTGTYYGNCGNTLQASTTRVLGGLGAVHGATCSNGGTAMDSMRVPVSSAGTLQNLVCTSTAGGVNSSSGVTSVYVNGIPTGITCTFGMGKFCKDTTHTYTVSQSSVANDGISVSVTSHASETLANVGCSIEKL